MPATAMNRNCGEKHGRGRDEKAHSLLGAPTQANTGKIRYMTISAPIDQETPLKDMPLPQLTMA